MKKRREGEGKRKEENRKVHTLKENSDEGKEKKKRKCRGEMGVGYETLQRKEKKEPSNFEHPLRTIEAKGKGKKKGGKCPLMQLLEGKESRGARPTSTPMQLHCREKNGRETVSLPSRRGKKGGKKIAFGGYSSRRKIKKKREDEREKWETFLFAPGWSIKKLEIKKRRERKGEYVTIRIRAIGGGGGKGDLREGKKGVGSLPFCLLRGAGKIGRRLSTKRGRGGNVRGISDRKEKRERD